MGRLEGKKAVVTGATSGIGRATAIMFAKEGATLVCTGRNQAKGDALIKEITEAGGKACFIAADLSTKAGCDELFAFAKEQFGDADVLMNCAGVLVHKPFLEQNDDDFEYVMNTNLRAYIWNMQNFIPGMVELGGGSIINVASISAFVPELNSYFYGCTKASVANLSMNVAKEYAPKHVRINVIEPGPVTTGMTPAEVLKSPELQKFMTENIAILGRLGEPDDIAYLATYLASDESSWVTGAAVVIDGGVHLHG
ncbi:MAG: SDR family oxidoreductase [Eggerthellaceae bacterium]|nr:SDR family oxidoreductase [Eggerthellaceae bacterium]